LLYDRGAAVAHLDCDHVFAGLKVAMVLSVIGAVVGEFAGSQAGIGFLIRFSAARLSSNAVRQEPHRKLACPHRLRWSRHQVR
jgi:hypothetical protein